MTNEALKLRVMRASQKLAAAHDDIDVRRGERDHLMVECADAGVTYDELAAITGLSYAGVSKVLRQVRAKA